ncbi:MAG: hypothetical protein HY392_04890 [Candidatus Diapherotrites archaeon]|nr:hypothetical protein [Candidatus Diapherotrites archaeon]
MPGAIFECTKCGMVTRTGYPTYAVQFAASKRGASEQEIIEDFFSFNKGILRSEPEKCPHCGVEKKFLKKTREID